MPVDHPLINCPPVTCRPPACPQVRRVFFTLPEALKQAQPGARQACYRHFKGSGVWDLSRPQEALRQRAQMLRATVAGGDADSALPSPSSKPLATPPSQQQQMQWMQQEQQSPASPFHQLSSPRQEQAAGGVPSAANGSRGQQAEAMWGHHLDAASLAERFPPTLHLPPRASLGRLAATLAAARERTGVTGEHLALALQLAVAMAAACTLHVTPASYAALHEKTIWAVVTGGRTCSRCLQQRMHGCSMQPLSWCSFWNACTAMLAPQRQMHATA